MFNYNYFLKNQGISQSNKQKNNVFSDISVYHSIFLFYYLQ